MRAYLIGLADAPGVCFKAGLGLLLVGLAFKLALAPFHTWAPDAYQGAPTSVTAFMSAGTKTAAFAAALRVLVALLPPGELGSRLLLPMLALGAISMFVGSLAAIRQEDLKRLLAYSGVAHAGYLTMALVGLKDSGVAAGVFYLFAYALMNIGALAVVAYLDHDGRNGADIQSYKGMMYRRPWLGVAMALFLLSLTGMPPAAGFVGKLRLLQTALENGGALLAASLVITTGISAFAYLRVVLTMFARVDEAHTNASAVAEVAAAGEDVTGDSVASDAVTADTASGFASDLSHTRNQTFVGKWAVCVVIAMAFIGTLLVGVYPQLLLEQLTQLMPFT